ncbi:MAG: PIN domain protein [Phycisphaerae bacterium]|nr:PIN domain protein [Phycisphaerae bacterium]
MKKIRIYVDTSVIGGCLDEEFAAESLALIQAARDGHFILLLSDLLAFELDPAPRAVQAVLDGLPEDALERVFSDDETARLRDAYLKARVVGPARAADAHHIAVATVAQADLLVSWNFKHIVHWDKIRLFNAVNLREGYPPVEIRSPREVV